jgi:hypothetical protein
MALAAGTKLGSYEVVAQIDAAGSALFSSTATLGCATQELHARKRASTDRTYQGRLGALLVAQNHSQVRFKPSSNPKRGL